MIPFLKRIVNGLLFDEDAGPRQFALGLGTLGGLVLNGGNVPGTTIVVPWLASIQWIGAPCLLLAWIINGMTSTVAKGPTP